MIQQLLFHRVNAEAALASVGGEFDLLTSSLTHETQSALSLTQFALTGADVASQSPVFQALPVSPRMVLVHQPSITKLWPETSFLGNSISFWEFPEIH